MILSHCVIHKSEPSLQVYFCGDSPRDDVKSNAVLDTVRVYGKAFSPPVFVWGHPCGQGECKAVLDTVTAFGKALFPPVFLWGHSPGIRVSVM